MPFIATILSDKKILTEQNRIDAENIINDGAKFLRHQWLQTGTALDVYFECENANFIHKKLETLFHAIEADVITQAAEHRSKKMLISDMDSTMITCECIDELADFAGLKERVARITDRAMNGELDFKDALRERVNLLKGLDASVLETTYLERVKPMPGACELIEAANTNNCHTVLVSGGFTFFTSRVANELGFKEHYGNELEIINGKLTGKVIEPILDKESKLATLIDACKKQAIIPAESIALGDGANDLPMLKASGLGIAYHAKPTTQQAIQNKLNFNNLSPLIFVLGWQH